MNEKRYEVWGYPETTDPLWNSKGHFIGACESIDEARKLKDNATIAGWGTTLILDGSRIVE